MFVRRDDALPFLEQVKLVRQDDGLWASTCPLSASESPDRLLTWDWKTSLQAAFSLNVFALSTVPAHVIPDLTHSTKRFQRPRRRLLAQGAVFTLLGHRAPSIFHDREEHCQA